MTTMAAKTRTRPRPHGTVRVTVVPRTGWAAVGWAAVRVVGVAFAGIGIVVAGLVVLVSLVLDPPRTRAGLHAAARASAGGAGKGRAFAAGAAKYTARRPAPRRPRGPRTSIWDQHPTGARRAAHGRARARTHPERADPSKWGTPGSKPDDPTDTEPAPAGKATRNTPPAGKPMASTTTTHTRQQQESTDVPTPSPRTSGGSAMSGSVKASAAADGYAPLAKALGTVAGQADQLLAQAKKEAENARRLAAELKAAKDRIQALQNAAAELRKTCAEFPQHGEKYVGRSVMTALRNLATVAKAKSILADAAAAVDKMHSSVVRLADGLAAEVKNFTKLKDAAGIAKGKAESAQKRFADLTDLRSKHTGEYEHRGA
mgnify:FL=1